MNVSPAKFVIENLCYMGMSVSTPTRRMPLDTPTGALRQSGHWDCLPRVLWNRHVANSVSSVLSYGVCDSPVSMEASLGKDLQAVQKQILVAKAKFPQLQAPHSLPELQDLYQHPLGWRLSSTAGDLQCVKSSSAQAVAGPEHGCVALPFAATASQRARHARGDPECCVCTLQDARPTL